MSGVVGQKWGVKKEPWSRAEWNAYAKAWRLANPERDHLTHRKHQLKKKFGLSEEDYSRMEEAQGGVCAVCGRPETQVVLGRVRRMAVDHNHETNQIRGLLCGDCNRAIGMMLDSPELLEQAALYLRAEEEVNAPAT